MEYNNVKTVCLILNFVCLLLLLSLSYYVSRIGGLKKKGQTDFLVAIYALMALQAVSIGMLLSINAGASMRTFSLIWATISMAILPLLPVLMSIAIGKDFKLFEKSRKIQTRLTLAPPQLQTHTGSVSLQCE